MIFARLKLWALAAGGFLAALLAAWGLGRREGRRSHEADAMEADYEHADDIRTRVDRDLERVRRDYDDAGWRD